MNDSDTDNTALDTNLIRWDPEGGSPNEDMFEKIILKIEIGIIL